jgi:hypothetical protein
MSDDLAEEYSLKQWLKLIVSTNKSALPILLKRILLPTTAFTILMIAVAYLTSSGELRIPVKSIELHSKEFYEFDDLDVRYIQKKRDAIPVLYVKKKVNLPNELTKWFIVGLAFTCTTVAATKKLANQGMDPTR